MTQPSLKPFPPLGTFAADLLVAQVKLKLRKHRVAYCDLWIRRVLWALGYEGNTIAFHRAVRRQRVRRLRALLLAPIHILFGERSTAIRGRFAARRGA